LKLRLVSVSGLEDALDDPQMRSELGIVAVDLPYEALGVLSAEENLDRVSEPAVGA
jgi:hypothetical protein